MSALESGDWLMPAILFHGYLLQKRGRKAVSKNLKMPSINSFIVSGNLTRDPELKYTASGKAVANCSLAASRYWKKDDVAQEETMFIGFNVWGQTAEWFGETCRKGMAVVVEGRIKLDEWEDATSGQKRSLHKIDAQRVQLMEWPEDNPPTATQSTRPTANEDDIAF